MNVHIWTGKNVAVNICTDVSNNDFGMCLFHMDSVALEPKVQ